MFFLNKKNIKYFNKSYNISFSQLKEILYLLGFKRDKTNFVKYVLKENTKNNNNYVKLKRINSPFAVLEKLTIN